MCGIFSILNNNNTFTKKQINNAFDEGVNRGPEFSVLKYEDNNTYIGFHRLAINGMNEKSNQPMKIDNITLICNGEIYNYKELYKFLNINNTTDSDCEIIIHLYKHFGIEQTLLLLDGVFSFVLIDNTDEKRKTYVARDPYGVRPLYFLINNNSYVFASELKVINKLIDNNAYLKNKQNHVLPGTYLLFNKYIDTEWELVKDVKYHNFTFNKDMLNIDYNQNYMNNIYCNIVEKLNNAVKKRVVGTTDRPIACLLSGGLDSSLIASLVKKYYVGELQTFSIGMKGSKDIECAKLVAQHIGSKHTTIELTEEEFFDYIPQVIYNIESYDTTSVRASVGNSLIGNYICQNSEAKVIFNGDGSDEITGGYLYLLESPNDIEFDNECKRLLNDIYAFDVLRSDKSISSYGLEPRTPFLDRDFVNYYFSIPPSIRNPRSKYKIYNDLPEKYLLRKSFQEIEPNLLPTHILWRTKEAFSDGVSSNEISWYEYIHKKLDNYNIDNYSDYTFNKPKTKEQLYYRNIFESYYNNCSHVVPYFWMPKYVNATDSSARTLNIYKNNNNNNNS